DRDSPERLILQPPPAPKPRRATVLKPEEVAKIAVARRAKPSVTPGHVKLMLTLDIPRALAERLSARSTREGKNLEAVVIEILGEGRSRRNGQDERRPFDMTARSYCSKCPTRRLRRFRSHRPRSVGVHVESSYNIS